ncbi:MAG: hypothetical protein ACYC0O_02250 [Desulfurivibrionaceae bacterium]|jgi:hypothetical protein|nr:hypothetical protein [Pseudomonadota bacterium]MCG2822769.1 hypothetical protein [Desulfobulbaceae bacterium]MDP2002409.1 hypothetical protein [Desulfurivibrionaceae bacterium]MBU4230458.1 hypothetical protein [Pseudomonadota bacterium]MBU4407618.1 hypothetical protein [Pseudomonadota bacterium]
MKITTIIPGQQNASTTGTGATPAKGASFQDILAQELTAAKSAHAAPAMAAAAVAAPTPAALRLDGISLAEETINTLEKFSAALGNPSFSAQDLAPFASALEDDTAALVDLKNQLSGNNPLAALLERVATASYVEAAKLRRGDYHA